MLTLYFKPTCPFCQRVIQMAENLNVKLEMKDITEDEAALAELIEKGGENQVPFLVDSEKGASMYESNDIIEYIRDNYSGSNSVSSGIKPRIHVGGSVCESCEG